MRKVILAAILLLPSWVFASSGGVVLQKANTDINDKASLQEGAKMFVNYCMGCHSLKYQRYQRTAKDLNIPEELLKSDLMFTAEKVGEPMAIAMPAGDSEKWFGVAPPDLSVTARARGVDWLYTYLLSFYKDDSRPLGVNNLVFKDVGMPHVLWELQGWQEPEYETTKDANGEEHTHIASLKLVEPGEMTPEEYQNAVRNLVNFLDYVGEPAKLQRLGLGWKVLAFIFFFWIVAWFLKHEYWRDVYEGVWKR